MSKPTAPPRRKPRFRERHATAIPAPVVERRPAAPPPRPVPPPASTAVARRRAGPIPLLTVEQAIYAVIIGIAFVLRIWDVGIRAMHGDESVHAWLAWNLYNGTGYQYDPVYHGPLQFPITALFYFLFGVSNTTGRLMAVLFGTALVGLPYFLRRDLGRPAALLAAALVAISPAFVYVSRLERDDIFTSVFAMLMVVGMFGYLRTRRVRYVYLLAASAALSLAAMENTYITLFVFGSFLIFAVAGEALARSGALPWLQWALYRAGSESRTRWPVILGALALIVAALVLTIATNWYPPVPVVLSLFLIAMVVRQTWSHTSTEGDRRVWDAFRSIPEPVWLGVVTIVIAILFIFFSSFGTNLRGLWDWTQPLFANGSSCGLPHLAPAGLNPCRKDIVGGLFYWLSQHKVARGGQPWFYYTLLYGLYEQIAVVFGIGGMIWFLRRPTLFTTFLTYWAVLMFGIYSWAGEKFPWLMIHPLLPFLLLAAMFVVDVVRRLDAWRYPVLVGMTLLGALEIHNMYESSFVNGANPVDMMVYVQSAPDTPQVAHKILNLSNKATNGLSLNLTIDNEDTWPFAWYLRDMTAVGYPSYPQLLQKPYSSNPVIIVDADHQAALAPKMKDYSGHEYILRWWFPEDYKQLTWSSFFHKAVDPGYWNVIWHWSIDRRPFGPKGFVQFWLYVKKGFVSPY